MNRLQLPVGQSPLNRWQSSVEFREILEYEMSNLQGIGKIIGTFFWVETPFYDFVNPRGRTAQVLYGTRVELPIDFLALTRHQ